MQPVRGGWGGGLGGPGGARDGTGSGGKMTFAGAGGRPELRERNASSLDNPLVVPSTRRSSLVGKSLLNGSPSLDGHVDGGSVGYSGGAGSSAAALHIAQALQRQKLQSSKARVASHTPSVQSSASASYGVNGSHLGPGGGGPGGSGSGGAGGGYSMGGDGMGDGMGGSTMPSQGLHARQAQSVHDVVFAVDTWHHCMQRSLL